MIRADASPAMLGLLLLVVAVTVGHVALAQPLLDLFQEGEYVVPRQMIAAGQAPLLVHGHLDLWPSRAAAALFGASHLIVGTRLVNLGLAALAEALFLACAVFLSEGRRAGLIVAITVLLGLNGALAWDPISLHQGSPSVRDIGLLGMLLCLLLARQRPALFEPLAGLIAGLGLFWAYNRSLIALAVLIAYALARLICDRRPAAPIRTLVGLIVGASILIAADPAGARLHAANVHYWLQHNDIWRMPGLAGRWKTAAWYYLFILAAIVRPAFHTLRHWRDRASNAEIPILVALLLTLAIALQQTLNRPDLIHLGFALPWAVLLILHPIAWPALRVPPRAASIARVCLGALAVLTIAGLGAASAQNLRLIGRPLPDDARLAAPDVRATAAALARAPGPCTYALDNSAALYHLADKRPCSAIMIPVYAAGPAEDRLIADLAATMPAMIVGSSHDWQNAIDKRDYRARLPRLARWIDAHYAPDRTIGRFQLLRRTAR